MSEMNDKGDSEISVHESTDHLQHQLALMVERRDKAMKELVDLEQTEKALIVLEAEDSDTLETRVNIGEQFYVRANVARDRSKEELFVVDVGQGYLVEMNINQATETINSRKKWLEDNINKEQLKISSIKKRVSELVNSLKDTKL